MGLLSYLQGKSRLRIIGAAPEHCLNALTKAGISFSNVEREDALHYCISLTPRDARRAQELAGKCFCDVEILQECGAGFDLKRAAKRPVLLLGLLLCLFFSFYLQSYVWVIDIDGCEALPDEKLLRTLSDMEICVGMRADEIDMQTLRAELLKELPELSWVALNRTGGRICVLVCAREEKKDNQPQYAAADLIAVRDGVITHGNVSEGMRLFQIGESVKEGQVLVSGFEDYGLCLKGVCASGEIYGQTWHTGALAMPSQRMKKCYTGRTWTKRTLILGRKRINLSGNSSFLGTLCDKITDKTQLRLPNYRFPVVLETELFREYTLAPEKLPRYEAERMLLEAWQRELENSMVAGKIEQTTHHCIESGGLYVLQAKSICNELISRVKPMQMPYEGENK